jgi:tRNA pseudouridine38-40 synthase
LNRYFLFLAYNGKNYCGWQRQPNGVTVQQTVEDALSTILRYPIAITGAGRTDTGVHASVMAAHFDICDMLSTEHNDFVRRINSLLPKDIAVDRIVPVRHDAHARFDALSRTYHYYLTDNKDPFYGEMKLRVSKLPDFDAMNAACKRLFRYKDFTSFSKLHTDVKTNNCVIKEAVWTKEIDNTWRFTITADRFLRNMVRAIVGTLLPVGWGKLTIDDFCRIIESKDRSSAGTSAPANALFLAGIRYPDNIFLPLAAE